MRSFVALIVLGLCGCSSPGFEFAGAPASRQVVDGWQIDVFAVGNKAQAIRLNTDFGATTAKMAARGMVAIERATGCPVKRGSARGDQSVMTVTLACKP